MFDYQKILILTLMIFDLKKNDMLIIVDMIVQPIR